MLSDATLAGLKTEFDLKGYVRLEHPLPSWILQLLFHEFSQLDNEKPGVRFGVAGETIKAILSHGYFTHVARYFLETKFDHRNALDTKLSVIRSLMFQKSLTANWLVTWHRDRTVALKVPERVSEVLFDYFGKPTLKDGVSHYEARASIMNDIVTARIHVDSCSEEDGSLEIIEGSHKWQDWRNDDATFQALKKKTIVTLCDAQRGDIHLMHPLLLHRSAKSNGTSKRRILHLEMAADSLLDVGGRGEASRIAEWAHAVPFPE